MVWVNWRGNDSLRRSPIYLLAMVVALAVAAAVVPAPTRAQSEDGISYSVTVALTDPTEIQEILEGASILIGLAEESSPSAAGLANRIDADRQGLEQLLRGLGHYAGTVDIEMQETGTASGGVAIVIRAMPGPIYPIGAVDLLREAGGPLDRTDLTPDSLGLSEGSPATSSAILEAERRIVRRLRAEGLPFADVPVRQVWVDHATQRVDVAFAVAPGPEAPYGAVTVSGVERVDRDLIAEQAPFRVGEQFDPEDLAIYRSRLSNLGVFQSVRVEAGDEPADDGTVPVEVTVVERKPRFIGVRADYSTADGLGAGLFWGHRNVFGGAERLRLNASIGRLIQNEISDTEVEAAAELRIPAFLSARQSLTFGLSGERERPEGYERIALSGAVGLERELTEALLVRAGFEVEQVQVFEDSLRRDDRSFTLVSLPVGIRYDTRDDLLNPTEGVVVDLGIAPYLAPVGSSVTFTRARLGASAYYDAFGDGNTVLAGRIALGAGIGDATADLPPNLRFYAGGGGSVRGYGHQRVGPLDGDDPLGGRSLAEAAMEVRQRVWRDVAVVPFLDVGTVGDDSLPGSDGDWQIGAGLGLRYLSPLGPLRFDFAIPVNPRDGDGLFQVYVSIGQAF